MKNVYKIMSWLIDVFCLFAVALREYFSQFGAVERSQVLFVSVYSTSVLYPFVLSPVPSIFKLPSVFGSWVAL